MTAFPDLAMLESAEIDVREGLVGDNWLPRGDRVWRENDSTAGAAA
jgi:hypothetical protein